MLVAIEGIHGAGKTTLVEGLSSRRSDIHVISEGPMTHSEITELNLGQGGYLVNHILQGLAIERNPFSLNVADRWITSMLSYRWALEDFRYEQVLALVRKLVRYINLPTPDVTIVLSCDPKVALIRCTESLPWLSIKYLNATADYYENTLTKDYMRDVTGATFLLTPGTKEETLARTQQLLDTILNDYRFRNGRDK